MNLQKILTIFIAVIGVVGFIFWVTILKSENNEGMVIMMLWLGKILIFAAAIIMVVFSLKNMASDPTKIKKAGISLVGLLAVLAIAYGLSDGQEVIKDGKLMATESSSKWVGTGLRVFYILAVAALVAMVVSGVKKALNK